MNRYLLLLSSKTAFIAVKKAFLDKPFHGMTCAIPRSWASCRFVIWSFDNGMPNKGVLHLFKAKQN